MYKKTFFMVIVISITLAAHMSLMASQSVGPNSDVYVEFEEGDAGIGEIDPDEPGEPGDGGTGESGSLALNYASTLLFGKQPISEIEGHYATLTPKPYIQVTDFRGTGEGWRINARASTFYNTEFETESLLGSTITFINPSLSTLATEAAEPFAEPEVILKTNGNDSEKVVRANKMQGMGTWFVKWYGKTPEDLDGSVVLNVPRGSGMIGENVATITWLLIASPA